MEIFKKSIRGSPYIGVFCVITEEYGLFPNSTHEKELREFQKILEIEAVKTNLAASPLLGVFAAAKDNKVLVTEIAEKREIELLERKGLEVEILKGPTAVGNLIALNKNGCAVSPLISDKNLKKIEEFFKVKAAKLKIAETDVPGAAIAVNNKGFIVHPGIEKKEFLQLKKLFEVDGTTATANYGDVFVGNSVVGNSKAVLVGTQTSGFELIRIEEGLRGE